MTWAHSSHANGRFTHRVRESFDFGDGLCVNATCGTRLWRRAIVTSDPSPAHDVCPRCEIPPSAPVVYFGESPEGTIKIGCSGNVAQRVLAQRLVLLATEPGGFERERAVHHLLRSSLIAGEFFRATPEVVNYIGSLSGLVVEPA